MRTRRVTKIVNALASQQRIIYWLECTHTVSITHAQIEEHPLPHLMQRDRLLSVTTMTCPFCPDPPQAPPAEPPGPTAQQLFCAAGEPDVW